MIKIEFIKLYREVNMKSVEKKERGNFIYILFIIIMTAASVCIIKWVLNYIEKNFPPTGFFGLL